jgi:hypothetical protein
MLLKLVRVLRLQALCMLLKLDASSSLSASEEAPEASSSPLLLPSLSDERSRDWLLCRCLLLLAGA